MIIDPLKVFLQDWAFLTARKDGKFNTMTIGWGELGTLWNKDVITVYVKPNYEGTPVITLNGQEITGGTFTLTSDMIDGNNVIYATGVTPSSGTVVIDNGSSDGLGLTDYLLIILVVLIVIMAIMVAMRLMRS